ncbi:MAG: hypothetical protein ABJR46_01315 [Tateyamaria sp.]|uniref:tetratricopeptide repeat protein n=1 Tax=Tateyamaria sp. TaxID=1929288 RepID=UPI0032A01EEB
MFRPLILTAALAFAPVISQAQANTRLSLDFLPPMLEPQDVCFAAPATAGPDDLSVGGSAQELSDADRISYLRRDIRAYTNEDANGFYPFIEALIARRAQIDETFTEVDAIFARIELMLRAGRIDQLVSEGLVNSLRDRVDDLDNSQQMALARHFSDGTGVVADQAFAQELIREAAYGGNATALLNIARLAQEGVLIEGWDAPLDLTITMAFGGILGALDSGVCARAERIAQEYIKGDLVAPNPALALAWFRFAADMGGAEAAWKVVEFHLNGDSETSNNVELRRYLEQAVRLGVAIDEVATEALVSSGAVLQDELTRILGFNYPQDQRRTRSAIGPFLQLAVNIDATEANEGGLLLQYLGEIVQMPEAPGRIFNRLAGEVLVRKGRWAGEADALTLLEEATARGDGPGQRRLARMLVRYRDDPAQIARADSLLSDVVSRFAMPDALRDLDTLYRCQVNDAPRLDIADPWARAYAASGRANVQVSATDLLALSPYRAPETIAQIQSLALGNRAQMVASHAQRVQSDPFAAEAALRYWAGVVNQSDQTLEAFAELEFELATTPAQRDLAIEFFRRVYLNNGVTTALDLAIALVDYDARDPKVAAEIVNLLTMAGNRGEGAAIRLLSRLQADTRSEAAVFAEFADKIEARGDFLALMFAIPHIKAEKVDDYIDRAVSLMSCGTKDAAELGDAYAIRGDGQLSHHWREVGLHFDGGHVLSKLRLTNLQMRSFDDGVAPDPVARATLALAEGDRGALMRLIRLTSNAELPTYDAEAAVGHLVTALQTSTADAAAPLAALYRAAPEEIRGEVDLRIDIATVLQQGAESGDAASAFELGMLLRTTATDAAGLAQSLVWLEAAAAKGHRDAMFEAGYALGFGLGHVPDAVAAIAWLDQADTVGHPRAAALAQTLRIKGGL